MRWKRSCESCRRVMGGVNWCQGMSPNVLRKLQNIASGSGGCIGGLGQVYAGSRAEVAREEIFSIFHRSLIVLIRFVSFAEPEALQLKVLARCRPAGRRRVVRLGRGWDL